MPNWRSPAFDWDERNIDHLVSRHDVSPEEAERDFFTRPHIRREGDVYIVLGQDQLGGRFLFLVCVPRGRRVRVVSARDMKPDERRFYERHR